MVVLLRSFGGVYFALFGLLGFIVCFSWVFWFECSCLFYTGSVFICFTCLFVCGCYERFGCFVYLFVLWFVWFLIILILIWFVLRFTNLMCCSFAVWFVTRVFVFCGMLCCFRIGCLIVCRWVLFGFDYLVCLLLWVTNGLVDYIVRCFVVIYLFWLVCVCSWLFDFCLFVIYRLLVCVVSYWN